jgi:hypothetical protein
MELDETLRSTRSNCACTLAFMPSALEGFLAHECDGDLASRLRAEIAIAQGAGYDVFEFNMFDVELFYGEDRVLIKEAVELGCFDSELTLAES